MMNYRPFFALARLSLMLLLPLVFVSCGTYDYSGQNNRTFLGNRAPKYGHGGTDSPKYGAGSQDVADANRNTRPPSRYGASGERQTANKPAAETTETEKTKPKPKPKPKPKVEAEENTAETEVAKKKTPPRESNPPESKPKASSESSESLPYAIPVPGKDGIVYSPFKANAQLYVRGMPSGSKARCTYTGKIFRVP
jgi:hypothetical protein